MKDTAMNNKVLKSLIRSRSAENLIGNLRLEPVQECKEEYEELAESGILSLTHSCQEDECASGPRSALSDTSNCSHAELSTSPFLLPIEGMESSHSGMRRSSSENNICYKGSLMNKTSRPSQPSPAFQDFLLKMQAAEVCKKSNQLKLLHKISRSRGKQYSAKIFRGDSFGDQLRSRYLERLGITRRREMQEIVRVEEKKPSGNMSSRTEKDTSHRRIEKPKQPQKKQTCSQAACANRRNTSVQPQQEMNYLGGWIF
ncbi:hypothetical protein GUITHDRAFT_162323 [Guillardia theta CCMP2712]|uniref:Uncharacterized protein n=1 Tax=Guillardia theta (strain CCMP2712) TaxID=905079 RepID=L1JKJ0_GUITC|nr:hypothetical protein GUITHDRAFT_162323 [Guillardia theta CCMP2712]EKX48822.1 hypothetical protein GUITHDRAFT_162323 [Guillardia theta CCMP2712]|mmetsp:Transcript_17139/g.56795  ORF Transcript_17139/g.56795 Transcript_17139/m.56795 type:complete len:257 (-) Transcript_17139:175-945(-)|eukprot:XP_005835802.1 hypothetical protein GUITHDRAFT_162323 [Guillardia theta CCMP2712]